ncbi:DEAD/DEAH box helicase [Sporosarcina ureilytica]|uniref:RNA helicase n=1 Tax=Sporosarcina ureilytica TaxID=298596 RepID=A0A1D8JDR2_9BACL|nr:DEAD/DEAH box helicase [Sporosarcina ureilytica]AOV06818.1 RNA helicase [Sporosarcina ureilytica]
MSFVEKMDTVFQEKWKFKNEMPIQTKMVPEALDGKDIVAESPTGTGKTLAYVLPLLHLVDGTKKQTQALIVVPSQELAMQITDIIREWVAGTAITVAPLIGGANVKRQIERLKKKPTIVVGTPGRLMELSQSRKLKLFDIRHIVLDEGDVLLSREHRVKIKNMISGSNPDRQVIVVSATITDEIERVANEFMNEPLHIKLAAKHIPRAGTVTHSFIETSVRDKTDILRGLSHLPNIHALAFVNNVDQVWMKEAKLLYNKAPIVVLHSNMRSAERQQALESFRKGKSSILIATDLAARGLDIEGLTHVIHVDVPHTIEQYLHRSGRTGRAGEDGEVLTLLAPHEEGDYRKLTKGLHSTEKIWRHGKLQEKQNIRRK